MLNKNVILFSSLLVIFLLSFLVSALLVINVEKFYYWYLLIVWSILVWRFKLKSGFSLWSFLTLFIIAILINIAGFASIAETIMRVSFIELLTGLLQAFIEYNSSRKPTA